MLLFQLREQNKGCGTVVFELSVLYIREDR